MASACGKNHWIKATSLAWPSLENMQHLDRQPRDTAPIAQVSSKGSREAGGQTPAKVRDTIQCSRSGLGLQPCNPRQQSRERWGHKGTRQDSSVSVCVGIGLGRTGQSKSETETGPRGRQRLRTRPTATSNDVGGENWEEEKTDLGRQPAVKFNLSKCPLFSKPL